MSIVFCLALATVVAGVLQVTLVVLAAQITAAFTLEWVADARAPDASLLAAAVAIVLAVGLVGRRSLPATPSSGPV